MNLPIIEHAAESVRKACARRLEELFPKGTPEDVTTRYLQELSYLENSSQAEHLEIFRHLCLEAKKSANLISVHGNMLGSFLYFLLGRNAPNPLPPYYYCPECGYYEKIITHRFGIDLPSQKCPHCGREIFADGFNLSYECVWNPPVDHFFECIVNHDFLPFAGNVLRRMYPENEIVPLGIPYISRENSLSFQVMHGGYVILPSGCTIKDFPDMISYLENGDLCLCGSHQEMNQLSLKIILLPEAVRLNWLIELQRATGIYTDEAALQPLRIAACRNIYNIAAHSPQVYEIFHALNPKSYRDLVSVDSCFHNTFTFTDHNRGLDMNQFQAMINSEAFQKYPCFTREDFFDFMIEAGVEPKISLLAYNQIRKGYASFPGKRQDEFFKLPLPDEIKRIACNYNYVYPRMECVQNVLDIARIASYAEADSRIFQRIIHSTTFF